MGSDELFPMDDKCIPFALSLSKGIVAREGFDRLSPNGCVMDFGTIISLKNNL